MNPLLFGWLGLACNWYPCVLGLTKPWLITKDGKKWKSKTKKKEKENQLFHHQYNHNQRQNQIKHFLLINIIVCDVWFDLCLSVSFKSAEKCRVCFAFLQNFRSLSSSSLLLCSRCPLARGVRFQNCCRAVWDPKTASSWLAALCALCVWCEKQNKQKRHRQRQKGRNWNCCSRSLFFSFPGRPTVAASATRRATLLEM